MLRNYFKISWRSLQKNRQSTLLNLLGLSTALAGAIIIYLWVNDELKFDKFHAKDNRLYKMMYNIQTADDILTLDHTPSPLAEALVKEMPEVEQAVSVNTFTDWFAGKGVVTVQDKSVKVKGMFAGKSFFNVFSYKLLEGNKDQVLTEKNGVVISESVAKKLFGTTANVIGKTIEWNHRMNLKEPSYITGIFEDIPSHSTQQFDILFNYERLYDVDANTRNWNATAAETYVVLKKGVQADQFENKVKNFTQSKDPFNKICSIFIQQFSDKYLHGKYDNGRIAGGRIQYVQLFSIIALLIVIIACINFINLTTAQASGKMKEIGIKKTLGANRKALIFQFLAESTLLTFLSVIIAIGLVLLFLPQFNVITGKQLTFDVDTENLLYLLGLVLAVGILSGSYPAFYLSGFKPVTVLKSRLGARFGTVWIRKGLVIVQFSLSVIFIVGFIVIQKQMDFTQSKDLGYNRANIISFLSEGVYKDREVLFSELKSLPGVMNAGSMPGSIFDGDDSQAGFSWRGQKSDESYLFRSPRVGYNVIEILGLELLEGRSFSKEMNDNESRIILNASAVKKMGLTSPVGKIIKSGQSEIEIIGVVKDFQYGSLHQAIEPLIFRYRNSRSGNNVLVKIREGNESATLKQIEAVYKKFHVNYPFEYAFMDDQYQLLYASEQRAGNLSIWFAGLAILISCLGLFGLASFSAQKRRKEIGIRKIAGATAGTVFALLVKDFLKLVLIAIVVAFPLAWWAANAWLQEFAYRVSVEWWVFLVAGIIASLIALITISFQTMKAAVANPIKSLKAE